MVRRRVAEQPTSRLAVWARRIALFSLIATFVAIFIGRSGALDIVPALSTLAGALVLALVAILLAFSAGVVIWIEGTAGTRQAVIALLIGLALVVYPAYLGFKVYYYRLPAIYDVTTDPIDPPRFDAIARLRPRDAHLTAYQGLSASELQHAAYSDIEPELTGASPQQAYDAVLKVINKRRWRIVDARPPQETGARRDGRIEAVARPPMFGFHLSEGLGIIIDDVVVRIRATPEGARIDFRSASRYGQHDLGSNAARVRALIDDVDDALASPGPEKPAPRPSQAAGKGNSVRR
jgi:uncharacterized protein (DUF1499 family)